MLAAIELRRAAEKGLDDRVGSLLSTLRGRTGWAGCIIGVRQAVSATAAEFAAARVGSCARAQGPGQIARSWLYKVLGSVGGGATGLQCCWRQRVLGSHSNRATPRQMRPNHELKPTRHKKPWVVRSRYAHMRANTIILLPFVVSALFSACNRPSDSSEVQRLREEVERLKSARPSASPLATPAAESPDYQNFLRVARRLMTTIESGPSFQDFHGRVADVLASAKEALRSVPTPIKQKAIATFATAITDANDIWSCSGGDADESLRYGRDKSGFVSRYYEDVYHSCGRWDFELSTLVAAYKLDTPEPGYLPAYSAHSSWPVATVRIDLALKKIFKVCIDTFEILEASQ